MRHRSSVVTVGYGRRPRRPEMHTVSRATRLGGRGPERTHVTDFYEFEMASITGEPVAFSEFRGQVALVVNVASR